MKPKLLSEQCPTCIGRPGNVMDLRPGRVQGMVQEGVNGRGITCHSTLSYGQHPKAGESMCRWFYDKFGPQCNYVRIMERLGGFDEVDLPQEEKEGK